jgi:hypothetical protein
MPLGNLATDSQYIYWGNLSDGGAIMKARKDGREKRTILASDELMPLSVAVDDTHVYWTTVDFFPSSEPRPVSPTGRVMRLSK